MNFLVKYSADGRITLPREVRQELKLRGGKDLSLHIEDGKIVVEQIGKKCSICGSDEDLSTYNVGNVKVDICNKCLLELKKI